MRKRAASFARVLKSFRKLAEFLYLGRPISPNPILPLGLFAHWIARCYEDFPTDTKPPRNHEKRIPMIERYKRAAYHSSLFYWTVEFAGFFY